MLYSKEKLISQLQDLGIHEDDTVLVHSSMKAIGEVENGAEGVLDAFIEYFEPGLLIFPTHTWASVNKDQLIYDPLNTPSCVGILSNLFLKRSGAARSLHPTHSVAAIGNRSAEYLKDDEKGDTPCPRTGCWGKLYDLKAKILFIGCSLKKNTILHGVEEWNNIPNRLTEVHYPVKIKMAEENLLERPLRFHYHVSGDISENYDKIENELVRTGIATMGKIGDAKTYACRVPEMVDLVSSILKNDPDFFVNSEPVSEE